MSGKYDVFKSGTDIRGVAAEGVVGEPVNLTDDVISEIVMAFSLWLCKKYSVKHVKDVKIAVGHDSRISAERIRTCVVNTLKECGFNVYDCALASTPAMFMTTIDLDCDGAVMITASHHPFNRNGLKFFTKDGGLTSKDLDVILQIADGGCKMFGGKGTVTRIDYMSVYAARLRNMIIEGVNAKERELPLKGYKIVVDAGNGAGGFYANKVLAPLGADISGSQFLEPDGTFPNHIPNPENPVAMDSAREAVIKAGADLGVIFDTDVDRAAVVDNEGTEINRNSLIALAAAIELEKTPGATIVTDSVTSDGLTYFIETALGGVHHRFKRGYRNVIDEAVRLNSEGVYCPLAIETSGHAALKENYFLDDGAYLATKIIITMAKIGHNGNTIGHILLQLPQPAESIEHRVGLPEENFREVGNAVLSDLKEFAIKQNGWSIVEKNYEGVRVSVDKQHGDGWFLLRLSVHDPVMPLNVESNVKGGTDIIIEKLKAFFEQQSNVAF